LKSSPLLAAAAALLLFAPGAPAQPRGSERSTMTQIVNGTTLTLFDVADEMTLRILVENGVSTGAEFLWEGEVFGIGEKVGR